MENDEVLNTFSAYPLLKMVALLPKSTMRIFRCIYFWGRSLALLIFTIMYLGFFIVLSVLLKGKSTFEVAANG